MTAAEAAIHSMRMLDAVADDGDDDLGISGGSSGTAAADARAADARAADAVRGGALGTFEVEPTRLAKPAVKPKGKAAAKKGKPAKPAKTVENSRATRMAAMSALANKEKKANPIGSTRPNTGVPGRSLRGNFAAEKRGAGATPGIDNRKEVKGLPQRSMVKDFGRMV